MITEHRRRPLVWRHIDAIARMAVMSSLSHGQPTGSKSDIQTLGTMPPLTCRFDVGSLTVKAHSS